MSRSQQEASKPSSLSYEQGGAAASPHTARGLGRGWPTEAIGDYVMKKERLAVDCPLVCPEAGFVIRGKLSEPS